MSWQDKVLTSMEKVTGSLQDKKKFREYRERATALPDPYRTTVSALERYLLHVGGIAKGDVLVVMLDDLAVLFEQAAADGTPVRDVVGPDPVVFAEDFIRNYEEARWMEKERRRLVESIDEATGTSSERGEGWS